MFHNSQAVLALSKEPNPTVFQKTLGVNDFYFASDAYEFPMGNIQMVGKSQAPMFRGEKPGETRFAPSWTLRDVARHAVDFWLSTEDLPLPENRVTLARDGNIQLSYSATNDEPKQRLFHQLRDMLAAPRDAPRAPAAASRLPQERDPGRGRRAPGGHVPVRHRPRRRRSSTPDCRAHEVDNLYVVDTSFFPSIGAVNPALTAMANALRVGDHLLERMGATLPGKEQADVHA